MAEIVDWIVPSEDVSRFTPALTLILVFVTDDKAALNSDVSNPNFAFVSAFMP